MSEREQSRCQPDPEQSGQTTFSKSIPLLEIFLSPKTLLTQLNLSDP